MCKLFRSKMSLESSGGKLPGFKESFEREGGSRHINIGLWQNLTFHGHRRSFLGNKSNKSQLFSILISSARHGRSPFLGHKSTTRAFTTSIIHGKAFCATGGGSTSYHDADQILTTPGRRTSPILASNRVAGLQTPTSPSVED